VEIHLRGVGDVNNEVTVKTAGVRQLRAGEGNWGKTVIKQKE